MMKLIWINLPGADIESVTSEDAYESPTMTMKQKAK